MPEGRDRSDPLPEIEAATDTPPRETAVECLSAALAASHPRRVVADAVSLGMSGADADGSNFSRTIRVADAAYSLPGYDRVLVVGGGKAAAGVADALDATLGDVIDEGVVVVPGDTLPAEDGGRGGNADGDGRIARLPGDHPVPSERAVEATARIRTLLGTADDRTLVLAVVTGGASALLPAPAADIDLSALRATTEALVSSGAAIGEINAVRKHLSELKGGGLARTAAPATVVSLVLSDVVGDRLDVIASGPTVPDRSTFDDALAVLDRYEVPVPDAVRDRLERGAAGDPAVPETPTPGDSVFDRTHVHVLASTTTALEAAGESARASGYDTCLLTSRLRGEARASAGSLAAVAEEILASGNPVAPPAVVVSGGESTVTLRDGPDGTESGAGGGTGTGGPNQEVGLGFALSFDGAGAVSTAGGPGGDADRTDPLDRLADRIAFLSVDSDGIDGASDAAGALVDPRTVAGPEDREAARVALDGHDALPYLDSRGDLIRTGPTGTNVNDLYVLVVEPTDES
jgi:hydroxypyruvate reductase